MIRLLRFIGLVAVMAAASNLLSPCSQTVQAQSDEPPECLNFDGFVPCELEQCQYRCECQGTCDPVGPALNPCCGLSADCRCPGYPITDGDYHCLDGGWCCCHDQCCERAGLSHIFCFLSVCSLYCAGGCDGLGPYNPPPPDDCDGSQYPMDEPPECLNFDGFVPCELEQCQYRCECQG